MIKTKINEQIKITSKIFNAMLIGQIILFAVALWFVQTSGVAFNTENNDLFKIIIPLYGILVMVLSKIFYNKRIASLNKADDLISKLAGYRFSKIVLWAIIETATFAAIVVFMITGFYFYSIVAILVTGYFILNRPSARNIIQDLNLSPEESKLILNK